MSNYVTSMIRTWVPVVVGSVIGWVLSLGIFDVSAEDQAKVTATAVAAAIAGYHALIRYLEQRWSFFGVLLGSKKQPEYVQPPAKVQAEA